MAYDCDLQRQPVCPYCGHIQRDAWEIDFGLGLDGDTDVSCGECGKEFHCRRDVSIYFTSKPKVAP